MYVIYRIYDMINPITPVSGYILYSIGPTAFILDWYLININLLHPVNSILFIVCFENVGLI